MLFLVMLTYHHLVGGVLCKVSVGKKVISKSKIGKTDNPLWNLECISQVKDPKVDVVQVEVLSAKKLGKNALGHVDVLLDNLEQGNEDLQWRSLGSTGEICIGITAMDFTTMSSPPGLIPILFWLDTYPQ